MMLFSAQQVNYLFQNKVKIIYKINIQKNCGACAAGRAKIGSFMKQKLELGSLDPSRKNQRKMSSVFSLFSIVFFLRLKSVFQTLLSLPMYKKLIFGMGIFILEGSLTFMGKIQLYFFCVCVFSVLQDFADWPFFTFCVSVCLSEAD